MSYPAVGSLSLLKEGKDRLIYLTVSEEKRRILSILSGNEYTTPPEIMAFRPADTKANSPGWTLRVMSNKFPALQIFGDLNKSGEGMFDKMSGIGAHEVVVETPDHMQSLATIPLRGVEDALWAYYMRLTDLRKDRRLKYVLIFKNEGDVAGASLEHSHTQLIALPIIPKLVKEETDSAKRYFDLKERCIFCDVISQSSNSKKG